MAVTPGGLIVAGTSANGIFVVPGSNAPADQLNQNNGLSGNSSTKVLSDARGYIWACSENGLDRISCTGKGRYHIAPYPLPQELSGSSINDIAVVNNRLYLATPNGIIILNSQGSGRSAPMLWIQAINNKAPLLKSGNQTLVLPYDSNSLQVSYTGVSFEGGRHVNYRYFLKGGSKDTIYTSARAINFSALEPGEYELLLWARNFDGPWTQKPSSFQFQVLSPWWRAPWAIGLAVVSLALVIIAVYRYRIKRIKLQVEKASRNKQQMAELELKALRAQVNPHFVSNALNAIQAYYSQNNERKANHYMTAFAQFIRSTLSHSQSNWLSIADEVAMLRTYIELEQMRFKQLFSFTITVSPQIKPEAMMIPAMLIQPYVENAINHGLRYLKDRKGILYLSFELQQNVLCCIVEDNGVGLQQTRKDRPSGHQSLGMTINRQRVNNINQLYQSNINISIIDKKSGAVSTGTIIKILIPIKNELNYDDRHSYR